MFEIGDKVAFKEKKTDHQFRFGKIISVSEYQAVARDDRTGRIIVKNLQNWDGNNFQHYLSSEFETISHSYRLVIEQDYDAENPWKDWDCMASSFYDGFRKPDFADHESGEHNENENETYFYRENYNNREHNFIYIKLSKARSIREKFGLKPCNRKELIVWINEQLDSEEETLSQYLEGEVYSFTLERKPLNDEHAPWEFVDSCGGFWGEGVYENGMTDHVNEKMYIEQDMKDHLAKMEKEESYSILQFSNALVNV